MKKKCKEISQCPNCLCMTHTLHGKCGKCGEPKKTKLIEEFEKGKWFYCYENGIMTAITGERMPELKVFIEQVLEAQKAELLEKVRGLDKREYRNPDGSFEGNIITQALCKARLKALEDVLNLIKGE